MKTETTKPRVIKTIATNRRARHDYEIVNVYEAGIVLCGTEVKSLRSGQSSLQDAHCKFLNKDSYELYVYGFHINIYEQGSYQNHEPKRPRKLLLNYRELKKIKNAVMEKSMVIIPLSIYFSGHLAKVEIGICRAKKKYDKREAKKEQDVKREISRKFKL
ncbi:SsrA-binding protein [bioreactor metagenome]|uniref:SsrA-binding protein n=1 Tax=bioreactor metagenome TaxID=1076179 RepID=A0A645EJ99_9ZZZZ